MLRECPVGPASPLLNGISEGLVCIFSVLEPCSSLTVAGNRKTQRLDRYRWCPMRKEVSNYWRYTEVAHGAHSRLIDVLANAALEGDALEALDRIGLSPSKDGRQVSAFNPVTPENVALFKALLAGEFYLKGFRNRDFQGKLYLDPPTALLEAKRRTHRTSRFIVKRRGHGLIAKVKSSRLYRITQSGVKTLWAAIRCRCIDFPAAFNRSESFAQ